jgi:ATP-binding cassette subfamily C protein
MLLVLMILSGISEGIGLLLLVPLLDLIGSAPHQGPALGLSRALAASGIPPTLLAVLTLFVGAVAFRNAIQYGRERLAVSVQLQFVDGLRRDCLTAVLKAEWRWIVGQHRSDHASLLLTDIHRAGLGLNAGLGLLAGSATTLACLSAAVLLSWKITALAFTSGGGVFLLLARQRRAALKLGQNLGEANRALHANVQQSLASIKLTKILGTEQAHRDNILATSCSLRSHQLAFASGASLSKAFFQTAGAAIVAVYVYFGMTMWQTPMPELLTLVVVFARLIPMFASLQQQTHLWLHARPVFAEIEQLLAACKRVEQPLSDISAQPLRLRETIRFTDVTLHYEGRREPALRNVSLQFPAGTTTAILGPSGAGKSTLADLLTGLLVPNRGNVEVDGVALTGSDRARWRPRVAYVPQDLFLFNETIRANLLWARPDASESELRVALERAAADFVFGLPGGLDTVVGDGGVRMSGGERQRIVLARALLTQPDVLVLDEATSALDLESEHRVQAVIEALHGSVTIFIVGHRLLNLDRVDMVVLLNQGGVVATGPWREVAGKKPFGETRAVAP